MEQMEDKTSDTSHAHKTGGEPVDTEDEEMVDEEEGMPKKGAKTGHKKNQDVLLKRRNLHSSTNSKNDLEQDN